MAFPSHLFISLYLLSIKIERKSMVMVIIWWLKGRPGTCKHRSLRFSGFLEYVWVHYLILLCPEKVFCQPCHHWWFCDWGCLVVSDSSLPIAFAFLTLFSRFLPACLFRDPSRPILQKIFYINITFYSFTLLSNIAPQPNVFQWVTLNLIVFSFNSRIGLLQ